MSDDKRCEAWSKGKPCPNYPRREVAQTLLCRDHLNMLKDGKEVKLQSGGSVRQQ